MTTQSNLNLKNSSSNFVILYSVFKRDIGLALTRKTDTLGAIFFFALVVSLFPLGIGSEPNLLRQIAPGVIWVSALLASMLSTNRLFTDDYQDGILEQLLLSPCPLELIVFSKILAHWCCTGLILLITSPILAIQFDMGTETIEVLMMGLAIGTPILSCIGAIGSALTLGLKSSGALISLLALPLLIPVLILGTLAVGAVGSNVSFSVYLNLLAALCVLSIFFGPIASAAGLRIALD